MYLNKVQHNKNLKTAQPPTKNIQYTVKTKQNKKTEIPKWKSDLIH